MEGMSFGIMSVVPTLIVIIMAIVLRKDIEPLIAGSFIGCIILAKFGFMNTFMDASNTAFANEAFVMVAQISLLFGALVEIMNRSRGAEKFSNLAGNYVKNRGSSIIVSWILGVALFIDDYMHAILVGTTMRKITDRKGVSRLMLAYIADATAGAMVVLLPFTTWAGFFIGIFNNAGVPEMMNMSGYEVYVNALPFVFYAFIAVGLSLLVGLKVIPLVGTLKKAEKVAMESIENGTQEEVVKEAKERKTRATYFILPLVVTVLATLFFKGSMILGIYTGLGFAAVYYIGTKAMTWQEFRDAGIDGAKALLPAVILLFFTFILVEANGRLGFAQYIIDLVQPYMSGNLLPVITFVVVSLICFSTGSFWGTAALTLPIVIPLAVTADANIFLTLGAIISGTVFGSHACIFGDVTILSSTGAEVDTMDHALSQMPYCIMGWILATAAYLAMGFII